MNPSISSPPPVDRTTLDEARASLTTVRDFVRWAASAFARAGLTFGHGTDNALDEAFYLVLWALRLPPDLPAVYLEATLTRSERDAVLTLLERRLRTREPAAYLTGEAWFGGLSFEVDRRVLIPRSPIAELIAARFAPWLTQPPATILDLCAGSGCIGIACAVAFPAARVDLAELDAAAVAVCRRNVARHALTDRVRVAAGDLFAPLAGARYDLIVTNPPYVPEPEWSALPAEYHHEPRQALAGGADGMDVMARILAAVPEHLKDGGLLVGEIGGSQAEFDARFPGFPAVWPEFTNGGDGVFVVERAALADWLEAWSDDRVESRS